MNIYRVLLLTTSMVRVNFLKKYIKNNCRLTHVSVVGLDQIKLREFIYDFKKQYFMLKNTEDKLIIANIMKAILNLLLLNAEFWDYKYKEIEKNITILCDILDQYKYVGDFDAIYLMDNITRIYNLLASDYEFEFVCPEEISDIKVEYIVHDVEFNIEQQNTIYLSNYYKYYWGIGLERYWLFNQNMMVDDYECIILGMSYVQRGINIERLNKKAICMAAPSQDLFFDYETLKYVLMKNSSSRLRFCIQEVAPYELWYDMSLSKNTANRSMYYYPQFGTMHHYSDARHSIAKFERLRDVFEKIFNDELVYDEFMLIKETNHLFEKKDTEILPNLGEEENKNAVEEVQLLFNKPYESTFKENILILDEEFNMLKKNNIIPIVLIPPYPQVFRDNMNSQMYKRTMEVIRECKERYSDIVVLNYLEDSDFDDFYFSDYSHLNYWGSNLLSDKLNVVLKELDMLY